LFDGHGPCKEEALAVAAAHVAQQAVLFAGFDAFGDDVHAEGTGEFDDGANDLQGLIAFGHASHEGAVDFEDIEGKGVEVVERTIARAEVVHEKGDAEGAQAGEDVDGGVEVGNETGLGHFQTKLVAGYTGLQEQGLHVIGEAGTRELARGEIDADEESAVGWIVAVPNLNLITCLGEAPVPDGQNQAGFLGMGNEIQGRDEAAFGVVPANEGFDTDDLAAG
jgi:hypothetical protein